MHVLPGIAPIIDNTVPTGAGKSIEQERRGRIVSNMILRSMVTIAGGAAVWGMLLIFVHLFWNPPSEMRPVAAHSLAVKMKLPQKSAGKSLQQVWCAFTQCDGLRVCLYAIRIEDV